MAQSLNEVIAHSAVLRTQAREACERARAVRSRCVELRLVNAEASRGRTTPARAASGRRLGVRETVENFDTRVVQIDGVTVLHLAGDLDVAAAPRLSELLDTIAGPLVLDCARLKVLAGSGLAVLAALHAAERTFTVRNLQPNCREVLAGAGMDSFVV